MRGLHAHAQWPARWLGAGKGGEEERGGPLVCVVRVRHWKKGCCGRLDRNAHSLPPVNPRRSTHAQPHLMRCPPTENVCEGFDHPEAPPIELQSAGEQLREATAHAVKKLLDTPRSRKWGSSGRASDGAGSQRSSELNELLELMAQLPRPPNHKKEEQKEQ